MKAVTKSQSLWSGRLADRQSLKFNFYNVFWMFDDVWLESMPQCLPMVPHPNLISCDWATFQHSSISYGSVYSFGSRMLVFCAICLAQHIQHQNLEVYNEELVFTGNYQ